MPITRVEFHVNYREAIYGVRREKHPGGRGFCLGKPENLNDKKPHPGIILLAPAIVFQKIHRGGRGVGFLFRLASAESGEKNPQPQWCFPGEPLNPNNPFLIDVFFVQFFLPNCKSDSKKKRSIIKKETSTTCSPGVFERYFAYKGTIQGLYYISNGVGGIFFL